MINKLKLIRFCPIHVWNFRMGLNYRGRGFVYQIMEMKNLNNDFLGFVSSDWLPRVVDF